MGSNSKAYAAQYYADHKAEINARSTLWAFRHPGRTAEITAAWRERNRAKYNAYQVAYNRRRKAAKEQANADA